MFYSYVRLIVVVSGIFFIIAVFFFPFGLFIHFFFFFSCTYPIIHYTTPSPPIASHLAQYLRVKMMVILFEVLRIYDRWWEGNLLGHRTAILFHRHYSYVHDRTCIKFGKILRTPPRHAVHTTYTHTACFWKLNMTFFIFAKRPPPRRTANE